MRVSSFSNSDAIVSTEQSGRTAGSQVAGIDVSLPTHGAAMVYRVIAPGLAASTFTLRQDADLPKSGTTATDMDLSANGTRFAADAGAAAILQPPPEETPQPGETHDAR